MRKIYLFLLALCVSSVSSLVTAQNYTVADAVKNATYVPGGHGEGRTYTAIALTPSAGYGEKVERAINEGMTSTNFTNYPVYNNITSTTFEIKAGATYTPSITINWDGKWMTGYFYVDGDQSGQFTVSSPNELVSTVGTSDASAWSTATSFKAPSTAGVYKMRYKVDYLNTDPSGSRSGFISDGGMIADIDLSVSYPVITFTNNEKRGTITAETENVPCGADYTFTITPVSSKYRVSGVTVKCGEQTYSPTDNGDNTYTISANQFQNDLNITVAYERVPSYTAAQAANGECYFRVKSSGGKYLKAGISSATATGGEQYVKEGLVYLYTWNPEDATETTKQASYIWKLDKQGDNTYMTSQGYRVDAIGTGDGCSVKMTETGKTITCAEYNSTGKYTFTTNEAGYTSGGTRISPYLHSVTFGRGNGEAGKYPNNSEGLNVSSWSQSATDSQWIIEPIEEFDITIGTGGWSTIHYAFPVSLPADEVTAYTVSSETESAVSLAEVEPVGGAILLPSNTPVFLAGTQGAACTVSILLSEPAAISVTNELDGTLLPESPTGNNIYGIATPSGKPTALYKMTTGTTIPCNKAYLVSTLGGVAKLDLDCGGTTTGIDSLTPNPTTVDSNVLYDLNGRRVLYPTRGIYVTGSGKKIYLK